jgi:hypothetical protein
MKNTISLITILFAISACADRPTACEIKWEEERVVAKGLCEIAEQKCEDAELTKLPADDTSCPKFCKESCKPEYELEYEFEDETEDCEPAA